MSLTLLQAVVLGTLVKTTPELITAGFKASHTRCRKFAETELQWSYRATTTAAAKRPIDSTEQGQQLRFRMARAIDTHRIPPDLVINFDQTAINLSPQGTHTYDTRGNAHVYVVGKEDKRLITGVLAVTASGRLLSPQLIYQGATDRSKPSPSVRAGLEKEGWLFSLSKDNHWANQADRADQKVLLVIDCWSVHRGPFYEWMLQAHPDFIIQFIPAGCTGVFQPCDVGLMKPFKSYLRNAFAMYLMDGAANALEQGKEFSAAFKRAEIRDLCVGWVREALSKLKPETLRNAWQNQARLGDAFDPHVQREARAAELKKQLVEDGGVEPDGHEALEQLLEELEEDTMPLIELARKRAGAAGQAVGEQNGASDEDVARALHACIDEAADGDAEGSEDAGAAADDMGSDELNEWLHDGWRADNELGVNEVEVCGPGCDAGVTGGAPTAGGSTVGDDWEELR